MKNLIKNFVTAKQELLEHVGLVIDWVQYPIDICIDQYWCISEDSVRFHETEKALKSDGDYYEDNIFKQRFYQKNVYRGELYTLIFCDPQVDGVKWWRIFNNKKEMNLK